MKIEFSHDHTSVESGALDLERQKQLRLSTLLVKTDKIVERLNSMMENFKSSYRLQQHHQQQQEDEVEDGVVEEPLSRAGHGAFSASNDPAKPTFACQQPALLTGGKPPAYVRTYLSPTTHSNTNTNLHILQC